MQLDELMTLVQDKTGRMDLSDEELIRLINASCKLLDSIEGSDLRTSREFFALGIGESQFALPANFRVATSVKVHGPLNSIDLNYSNPATVRGLLSGSPIEVTNVYSIITGGFSSSVLASDLPPYADVITMQTTSALRSLYMILYPVQEFSSFVEVEGLFGSVVLDLDSNFENYWTLDYPELVLLGVNYWLLKEMLRTDESMLVLKDLKELVSPVSFDIYAQQSNSQMGG